jgi:hypothetical protein
LVSYEGEVTRLTADTIVLSDATKNGRSVPGQQPLISKLPYVGRYWLQNTCENVSGEVSIERRKIEGIRFGLTFDASATSVTD